MRYNTRLVQHKESYICLPSPWPEILLYSLMPVLILIDSFIYIYMYINQLSEPSLTRECRNDKTIVKCKYLMHFIFIMNIYNSNYYKYNLFVDSVHIMHADYCFINFKIPHAIFFFNWEQTSFIDKYKVPIYIILHPTLLFILLFFLHVIYL